VAVYADTNVLPPYGDFSSLPFVALRAACRERGSALVFPELVIHEAAAKRLRDMEHAFAAVHETHRIARRLAPSLSLLPEFPNPGDLVRVWEDDLRNTVAVCALPPGGGEEALRREAHRLPPARAGIGARDAAIWLAIKHDHLHRREPGVFVTGNVRDFADPEHRERLHPRLVQELRESHHHLTLYTSVESLIEAIGTVAEPWLSADTIDEHNVLFASAIGRALSLEESALRSVARAGDGGRVFLSDRVLLHSQPEPRKSRCFRIDAADVTVAWLGTIIRIGVGVMKRVGGRSVVHEAEVIDCSADVQIWARRVDDAVEVEATRIARLERIASE
jgi:hypothetical protein